MIEADGRWWRQLTPQCVALLGSMLLSLVAYLGAATIVKDGARYVSVAQVVIDQGVVAAAELFHWLGFPLMLAGLHNLTGLPIEGLAYFVCALFQAGVCALLVDLVARRVPHAAWWAVLVVLAMPAFNAFRAEIIREHGFWFFSLLSLWMALDWRERGGWWRAVIVQIAIVAAALFRLEAVLLEFALALWLLPGLRARAGWCRLLELYWLPLAAGVVLLVWGAFLSWERVQYFVGMLSPRQTYQAFQALAAQFADTLKYKYSRDDAGIVIFVGVLGLILLKFAQLLGPFALPFLSRSGRENSLQVVRLFGVLLLAWLLYLLVLLLFFIHEQFINSRYLSFLNLLVVPLVAMALAAFAARYRRWGRFLLLVGLLVMCDNVISLSAKKTHYVEAGRWLAEHYEKPAYGFYDDPRIGYYAGWGYVEHPVKPVTELNAQELSRYQVLVIEVDLDEAWLAEWLARNGLVQVAHFSNRKGDTVQIIAHGQAE